MEKQWLNAFPFRRGKETERMRQLICLINCVANKWPRLTNELWLNERSPVFAVYFFYLSLSLAAGDGILLCCVVPGGHYMNEQHFSVRYFGGVWCSIAGVVNGVLMVMICRWFSCFDWMFAFGFHAYCWYQMVFDWIEWSVLVECRQFGCHFIFGTIYCRKFEYYFADTGLTDAVGRKMNLSFIYSECSIIKYSLWSERNHRAQHAKQW